MMRLYLNNLLFVMVLLGLSCCKSTNNITIQPGTKDSVPETDTVDSLFSDCNILRPTGAGNVYQQINDAWAGKGDVVETPDCSHPDFGPHIREEFNEELNQYVFSFYIHVTPDDDRCKNDDRQRTEIKTYDQSPDSLLAFKGDTLMLRWKFKLDKDFRPSPSFTHIHQLKPGDGDAANPIIVFTARYNKAGDQMEIGHYDSKNNRTVLKKVSLDEIRGHWIEAEEESVYNTHGGYHLILKNMKTGKILLNYSNDDIDMWRTGTTYCRPKWGIYRSLNDKDYLRDEKVLFTDFCIKKK